MRQLNLLSSIVGLLLSVFLMSSPWTMTTWVFAEAVPAWYVLVPLGAIGAVKFALRIKGCLQER